MFFLIAPPHHPLFIFRCKLASNNNNKHTKRYNKEERRGRHCHYVHALLDLFLLSLCQPLLLFSSCIEISISGRILSFRYCANCYYLPRLRSPPCAKQKILHSPACYYYYYSINKRYHKTTDNNTKMKLQAPTDFMSTSSTVSAGAGNTTWVSSRKPTRASGYSSVSKPRTRKPASTATMAKRRR